MKTQFCHPWLFCRGGHTLIRLPWYFFISCFIQA
jgi:hypothetical protein